MASRMKSTELRIEPDCGLPSNVIPLWPVEAKARRARPGLARAIEANAVAQDPPEQRLARRVERVLCALLYHAVLASGDLRGSKFGSVEKRGAQLVSQDRLTAIARAAISLDSTADLTRLAAVAISFEMHTQSHWRNRLRRLVSAQQRQIRLDTLAIAGLLASDLEALKLRPIDSFAKFL